MRKLARRLRRQHAKKWTVSGKIQLISPSIKGNREIFDRMESTGSCQTAEFARIDRMYCKNCALDYTSAKRKKKVHIAECMVSLGVRA